MLLDLKRETTTAWLVLAGTVLVAAIALWWVWAGAGPIADQLDQARAAHDRVAGRSKEEMRKRIELQRQANQELRKTIEKLKTDTGFELASRFAIPKDERQPGYLFKRRFVEIRQELREKAAPRSIRYDENIGFGTDDKVPDDKDAAYLMTMLQLTEKAVSIAIGTPSPLESLAISHGPAVDTGPVSRPVLLREYPLELTVRGSLKDILWILHRFSEVEGAGASGKSRDYPLILRGLSIVSENATPRDDIAQLDAVFQIAGMQFLSPEERDRDPTRPRGAASASHGASPVFEARP
jgi:hypothetical protein